VNLLIDAARITAELDALARFSESEPPAITRIVFSRPDRDARLWLKSLFAQAGLSVREDAVGNTFARWTGVSPELPATGTGSHIDAVPNSGKYDGTVGVLGALEAVRSLQRAGFVPQRSIELVLFTSEEPTRFGIGCLGSRLMSGSLPVDRAASLRDREGNSLDHLRSESGFDGDLHTVQLPGNYFSSFVELHIEQGPILEREQVPLGILTKIAAPATLRVLIEGEGGHAGAVLMPQRRDAFLAAAEIALAVEHAAFSTGSLDTVATTGVCQVFPGAVNSIPSRVTLEIDIRDTDLGRRDGVIERVTNFCHAAGVKRNAAIHVDLLNADDPAHCDPSVIDVLSDACIASGYKYRKMVSRAYHDSLFMARVAPIGMLFIPCKNGVSHRPDEYASPEDIATGVNVLARALAALAS
jgi:ureidoglycolate amidohydrolase